MTPNDNLAAAARIEPLPDPDPIDRRRTPACRYPASPCGRPPGAPGGINDPHDLVLELLKRIEGELSAARERDGMILSYLGRIELSIARLRREFVRLEESHTSVNVRMGHMNDQIKRIEQWLDITG